LQTLRIALGIFRLSGYGEIREPAVRRHTGKFFENLFGSLKASESQFS
jgi:hypothetical protein